MNPDKPIGMHHAWCPKNAQFEVSGAKDILEDLHCGLALKCEVCKEEYESGRSIKDGIHRLECPRRIPVDKMLDKKKSSQKTPTKKAATTTSASLVSTSGRKIRPTAKVRFASKSTLSLMGSQEDDSELSEFEPEESEQTKRNPSKTRSNTQVRSATKKIPTITTNEGDQELSWDMEQSKQMEGFLAIENDPDGIEVTWNVSENPWGPDSLENWDRIVLSSTLPLLEQEAAFLSERFVHDPFSIHPRYSKSHTTPEEGSHALVLHRTALCNAPWGFSVYRHEFGGACLVEDVTPMSPAALAVSCFL
jgi:hypothetical protein